jgi:hypothetical protein
LYHLSYASTTIFAISLIYSNTMQSIAKNNCQPCAKNHPSPKKNYGVWAGLLLAVLPKCPFCIMAYSGTLMLCSRDAVTVSAHTYTSVTTTILTSLFCLLSIIGIYFNKRGTRTRYALSMAIAGACMVMTSVLLSGGLGLYYIGVVLIFAGVWLNGSMLYFVNKAKHLFSVARYKPKNISLK